MTPEVTVTLYRYHPAEGWFSMQRYADMLEAVLRPLLSPSWQWRSVTPPPPWPLPRSMIWRRMLSYFSLRLRRRGLKRARAFSWEKTARKTSEVYEQFP